MFLKNHKALPWLCSVFAALFLSLGAVSLGAEVGKHNDNISETWYAGPFAEEETSITVVETEDGETAMNSESEGFPDERRSDENEFPSVIGYLLIAAGMALSVVFIVLLRQENPYLGPEAEMFFLSVSITMICLPVNTGVLGFVFYLWLFSFVALISMRGLWSWIWNRLPYKWSAGHRLGLKIVGNTEKQGRYLLFLLAWCGIALAGGILWIISARGEFLLLLPGVSLLAAAFLSIYCFLKLAQDINHLSEQVACLHQGSSVPVCKGIFAADEEKLLDLNRQREEAVYTAVTSERFRVDLISNVSHDLRTPLTSILGYGELLKEENLSPEGAKRLEELNKKTGYMQELVDSLFELTKVSSGVAECKKERLDLIRLLEQTIGLFDDQLTENRLQIRRHYEQDSMSVVTDGARIHQVFANLIGNAIKYTLRGTRIHLEVKENGGEYVIRMVNIASYEMDFDSDEILERFARGDKARTTKGSGLGLAIAKTYTESVGGTFQIAVDGEQFNAIVTLPKN